MRRPVLPSVLLAAALTLAACGGDDDPALTEPTETESVEEEVTEEPDATETESEEPEATETEDEVAGDDEPATPTPDPTAVDDPCADDQGREG